MTSIDKLTGLHHVTAIAGDLQVNIDYYMGFLGLRLAKLTVNFDDPRTYHLYYGDGVGHPGTIMTFFPWPDGVAGRRGTGQLTTTSFSIPENALEFWVKRFRDRNMSFEGPTRRNDDEQMLSFSDPDSLGLEIVAHPKASMRGLSRGPNPT